MVDGRSLTETIVGMLGTPHDRPAELIGFAIVAAAVAVWIAVEQGLAHVLARLLRLSKPKDPE